jgi:hypothetical protein
LISNFLTDQKLTINNQQSSINLPAGQGEISVRYFVFIDDYLYVIFDLEEKESGGDVQMLLRFLRCLLFKNDFTGANDDNEGLKSIIGGLGERSLLNNNPVARVCATGLLEG